MLAFFQGCRKSPRSLSKGPLEAFVRAAGEESPRVGKGCGCGGNSVTARVMMVLGMDTAASMHRQLAQGVPPSAFGIAYWKPHIFEEEAELFPAIDAVASRDDSDKYLPLLLADHKVYLQLLEEGQPLPTGTEPHSIDEHSRIEDMLIEKYAKELIDYAKSKARVSGLAIDRDEEEVGVAGASDSDYVNAGLPIPPKDSTGNDRSDKLRGEVWAGGLAAAKMYPAAAPYIAVGLVVFEGWIRVGAFLSGESKDDQKYQDQAQTGVNEFLVRGFVPRKWVTDVEFAADYAHYLGQQINALTLYPWVGDQDSGAFVEELNTDFGLTMRELIKTTWIEERVKKGNASPFSGMVPDVGWRYGIYDSYPDADLIGLVAAVRNGQDVVATQAKARAYLAEIRAHGVVVPSSWPTDPTEQAYASAAGTAAIWHLLGGKSRGFYLSASGGPVDPATGRAYTGPMNTPIEVMSKAPWLKSVAPSRDLIAGSSSSSGSSLLAVGAGLAALGGAIYLGWRYLPSALPSVWGVAA